MELAEKVLTGDVRAAARLMRGIEDCSPEAIQEIKQLYPHTGKAYVVGVTGAPGAGKSTLVDTVVAAFRQRNMTVGVVAVDPSSPFTGGAILGDRVRMQRHSTDQDVFIRSLATRGQLGGLCRAAVGVVHVMDAMHKDLIIIETVGIGQAEVDITRLADTTLLILTPTSGDAIQMMKAGILEVADIFVVNKADQEGASYLKMELQAMLSMKNIPHGGWMPSIVLTEANKGLGIEELAGEILKHKQYLVSSGTMERRRRARAKLELTEAIESALRDYIDQNLNGDALETVIDDLVSKKTDPRTAAAEIVKNTVKLGGS